MSWREFRDVIGLLFRVTWRLKTREWRGREEKGERSAERREKMEEEDAYSPMVQSSP